MKHKILAYITRPRAGGLQVLVFDHRDHPEAGTQVPAGTVERGEQPEAALWREIEEETGLRRAQLRLARKLTEADEPEWEQRRHVYHVQIVGRAPEAWTHRVRGEGEDAGMVFAFRWAGPDVKLAGGQGRFLSLIKESDL